MAKLKNKDFIEDFGACKKSKKNYPISQAVEDTSLSKTPVDCENLENKLKKSQWSLFAHNCYVPTSSSTLKLYPGLYSIKHAVSIGIYFERVERCADDLIDFPDSMFDNTLYEIENFWKLGDNFKKYGFLHRRGYLFYGPAGSGKSCLVQRIIQSIISIGGIAFICDNSPSTFSDGLMLFRSVEPKRDCICIFEDIDALIEKQGESGILSLLDGENQVDKVINIATTNYPERLDRRIVARPRRFDRVIKVEMPGREIRKTFFKNKLRMNGDNMEEWISRTEGLSFAALAELVISVKCLGNSFDETIEKLKIMVDKKASSKEFDECAIGFNKN